jgi:hypothetical protein
MFYRKRAPVKMAPSESAKPLLVSSELRQHLVGVLAQRRRGSA